MKTPRQFLKDHTATIVMPSIAASATITLACCYPPSQTITALSILLVIVSLAKGLFIDFTHTR